MFVAVVDISWPPKSPREVLLTSPNGRRKYQDMQRRQETLGSPPRQAKTTPNLRANRILSDGMDELDDEEDEDEETLQLKLAAIEARLKLKQLQKSRGRSNTLESNDTSSRPASAVSCYSRTQEHASRLKSPPPSTGRYEPEDVQVPLSPVRRAAPQADPASPRRYLLGIDKGLKGSDVSLKRPPSSRVVARPTSMNGGREAAMSHPGDIFASHARTLAAEDGAKRGKTFSERIADSRLADRSRREREHRLQVNRSSAFHVDQTEMEAFKAAAAEARTNSPPKSPVRSRQTQSFSRDDVMRSFHDLKPSLKRSQTASTVRRDGETEGSRSHLHRRPTKSESHPVPSSSLPNSFSELDHGSQEDAAERAPDSTKFEPYSSLHLSNRILPHSFLTRTLSDKKVLRIPDLLRTVRAPDFELPEDIDGDYIVFGIVASKSEPKQVKGSKNVSGKEVDPFDDGLNNSSRYMAITLTDLKWTVDLFLFDTAFPRYYRLSEGILIAILNPTIMPPPKNKTDTGRFSLSLSSSDDKILEVGYAQDIGFCKAVRKDGKTCQSWVDGRKTEFCDFHIDVQVRRTQSQRMGVNNGTGMFGPGGRSGPRTGFFGDQGKKGGNRTGLKPVGAQYDFQSQSLYYIAPAPKSRGGGAHSFHPRVPGQSAAGLIDADTDDPFIAAGMMGRGAENKEERFRRRLVEQQREREITQKLVTGRAGGVGAEYLRARSTKPATSSRPETAPSSSQEKSSFESATPRSANSLGLMGFRRADAVKLSPLKRAYDRPHGSGVKKTRFITSKGIKEAGRDSLGGKSDATANTYDDDDDDDELDIIP
ncbi:Mcm10/DnaG-type zinc finger protein [Aspergillus clavatus NRRL 1]|uniref:DNA replication protein, putative n=1 Tax=Aspergillus clavatus (strain ATCC 1007 / CBS 513.65 / DSM 816 / NCTC 3887 / NRRL 1 / QM 1276 / 107) TaxID=344612 RepID=A1CKD1_ASPCL|nr:DNA replication protein, putative [Aspergillus clavatus NRRL 1]EAW09605.1 DNA replication protein, putative [Aspergillus clavatus NRRL 1]